MNRRIHPIVAYLMFVAIPVLAQQGNTPIAAPATDQGMQALANVSSASAKAVKVHVVGTIATTASDRIGLEVEKVVGPSSEAAAGLAGQAGTFTVDARTRKPAELNPGERVDLWFVEDNGERRAVRIVVIASAGESRDSTKKQGAIAPSGPGTPGNGQPSAASASSEAVPALTGEAAGSAVAPSAAPESSAPVGSVGAAEAPGQPAADTAPRTAAAVPTDNPLRFIALGAAAGLVALVMLYFTLKAQHLELGIGSGKGGVG